MGAHGVDTVTKVTPSGFEHNVSKGMTPMPVLLWLGPLSPSLLFTTVPEQVPAWLRMFLEAAEP